MAAGEALVGVQGYASCALRHMDAPPSSPTDNAAEPHHSVHRPVGARVVCTVATAAPTKEAFLRRELQAECETLLSDAATR